MSFNDPIKCQCWLLIETSKLICFANQVTGFYMRVTLALNGLTSKTFIHDIQGRTYMNVMCKGLVSWVARIQECDQRNCILV